MSIVENRKARHDYAIEERYEAGIELRGTEVKSIRQGKINLSDTFARVERGLEFAAADVLHDDVGDLAFLAEIVDLDNIGVIQARNGLRLPREPH